MMNSESYPEGPFSESTGKDRDRDTNPSSKIIKQALHDPVLRQKRQSEKIELVRKLAPSKAGVFKKAFRGNSLRASINANCLDCMGYSQSLIRECDILDCPLHLVRPYQSKATEGGKS